MAKPTTLPKWNTNNNGNKTQAATSIQDDGVPDSQPLAMNNLNFELSTLADWCEFVDQEVRSDTENDARYLLESNNLSDLDNIITARANLDVLSSSQVAARHQENPFTKIDWDGAVTYSAVRTIGGLTVTRNGVGDVRLSIPTSVGITDYVITANGLDADTLITYADAGVSGADIKITTASTGVAKDADFVVAWHGYDAN